MKKTYIQPQTDTIVLPKEALMDGIPLAGSPTAGEPGQSSIRRRWTKVF